MPDEHPIGKRYSQIYLRPDDLLGDTPRFRRRLMKVFQTFCESVDAVNLGEHLEVHLGIQVLHRGYNGRYISWDDFLRFEPRDVLDSITLIYNYLRPKDKLEFLNSVQWLLNEEAMAYALDEKGGLHPAIDPTYQAAYQTAIRNLGSNEFLAAREHIERADKELLPEGNTREAIKAIFDAVENVFKQIFSRATSINKSNIQVYLRPALVKHYGDQVALRAATKIADSLVDWVDAAHNFRHEPGNPEQIAPPDDLVVIIVSQGLGFVRWLADIKQAETG